TAAEVTPEREAALLHVGEVHRVVHVAHRVAVSKSHGQSMAEGRHIDHNSRPPCHCRSSRKTVSPQTKSGSSSRSSPIPTSRSLRSETCPKPSRALFSRDIPARQNRCAGCFSTSLRRS